MRRTLSSVALLLACGASPASQDDSAADETNSADSTPTSSTMNFRLDVEPPACPAGQILCDEECVSDSDDAHCGTCDNACELGEECNHSGTCVEGCSPGIQNCPEGQKCTAFSEQQNPVQVEENKCIDIIGDQQFGELCERTQYNDDCAKGLFCFRIPTGSVGAGVCRDICDPNDSESCGNLGLPEADCWAWEPGVLPLCNDECWPGTNDCEPENSCYPGGGMNQFFCMMPGTGVDGDICDAVNGCNPGLGCVDASSLADCAGERCCTPMCDCMNAADPLCVDASEECVCLLPAENIPDGYEHVGACGLAG